MAEHMSESMSVLSVLITLHCRLVPVHRLAANSDNKSEDDMELY
jgi:hypothetical protein